MIHLPRPGRMFIVWHVVGAIVIALLWYALRSNDGGEGLERRVVMLSDHLTPILIGVSAVSCTVLAILFLPARSAFQRSFTFLFASWAFLLWRLFYLRGVSALDFPRLPEPENAIFGLVSYALVVASFPTAIVFAWRSRFADGSRHRENNNVTRFFRRSQRRGMDG